MSNDKMREALEKLNLILDQKFGPDICGHTLMDVFPETIESVIAALTQQPESQELFMTASGVPIPKAVGVLIEHIQKLEADLVEAYRVRNAERAHYRDRLQEVDSTAVWYWQGDVEDNLQTLCAGVPVVIEAETLRALLQSQPAAVPEKIEIDPLWHTKKKIRAEGWNDCCDAWLSAPSAAQVPEGWTVALEADEHEDRVGVVNISGPGCYHMEMPVRYEMFSFFAALVNAAPSVSEKEKTHE